MKHLLFLYFFLPLPRILPYTSEDIYAYIAFAEDQGYEHIVLAGHSLGANKVIYYLSRPDAASGIDHFFLLSPANLTFMMSGVNNRDKQAIKDQVAPGTISLTETLLSF